MHAIVLSTFQNSADKTFESIIQCSHFKAYEIHGPTCYKCLLYGIK